jgi:hypothetical protein
MLAKVEQRPSPQTPEMIMSTWPEGADDAARRERLRRAWDALGASQRQFVADRKWVLPTRLEVEPGTWIRTADCSVDTLRIASDARLLEGRQLIGESKDLRKALRLIWEADESYAVAEARDAEAEGDAQEA